MNVLLTSVGRRNYMVEYFKNAVAPHGHVYTANSYAEAAGMSVADRAFVVPPIASTEYIEVLLELCEAHNVSLILSLYDPDLPILSAAKAQFEDIGVKIAVSDPDVIDIAFDKWKTVQFCQSVGIEVPRTFLSYTDAANALEHGMLKCPLIVKPRWGMGSIGLQVVHSTGELESACTTSRVTAIDNLPGTQDSIGDVVIQEFIVGQEFGLDVINDLSANYITTFSKKKLEMRSGETDRALTVSNSNLEKLGAKLGRSLRHVASIDIDVILAGDTPYLIEINPRFGGHYPFSHIAGADIPSALVAWAEGRAPNEEWLCVNPGVLSVKGIQMIVVPEAIRDATAIRQSQGRRS